MNEQIRNQKKGNLLSSLFSNPKIESINNCKFNPAGLGAFKIYATLKNGDLRLKYYPKVAKFIKCGVVRWD